MFFNFYQLDAHTETCNSLAILQQSIDMNWIDNMIQLWLSDVHVLLILWSNTHLVFSIMITFA